MPMLYERWRQIARDSASGFALLDLADGRRWTFAQLAAAAENTPTESALIVHPRGGSADFILTVLRGWRDDRLVCPLEAGQDAPGFAQLPPGCAHLKFTSATSGAARAIAFTGAQLAADAANIVTTMGLRPDCPNVGVLSLAHSYGFSNLVTPLLLHGIPLVLVAAPLPEMVRAAAREFPEVALPAVPAMWRAWFSAGAFPANVRIAISAGAPLPLELERNYHERNGLKLHNFYGASECGGIAYDASEVPRTDAAHVGAPMKGVTLAVDESGCLEVRSRAVAETSWPTASPTIGGGIFRTTDLAELGGGQVFLRGRAGELINCAGRKVSPEVVERALLARPEIRECLVLAVPSADAARVDEIVAVVVSELSDAALQRLATEVLPAWQCPRHWWRVAALQANARGKVSRAAWRERWLTSR